ncbi:MerR family transcriptional regulator [Enterococcus sp. AZ072]|uniref:MerR family transcriptional regulator n=1 Tax=unclassified Enterococcus TaxID=2608891 RepID=UPI003D2D2DF4
MLGSPKISDVNSNDIQLKIGQVSQKMNISADTLRFYEKMDLIIPNRDESGRRTYSAEDLEKLNLVICLLETDLSIKEAQEFLELYDHGENTVKQRVDFYSELIRKIGLDIEKKIKQVQYFATKIQKTQEYL